MNIRQLFGLKSRAKPLKAEPASAAEGPATIEDGSANALRRQLVQVLVRDSLRRHGIPAHWLDCQMLLVSSRSRGEGMYVRLVVKHWDMRLLTYAVAFEKSLRIDITRFEPHAAQWLYGISWQLEVGDSCPYLQLPDRSIWTLPPKHHAESELKQDLERMFAIRDADMLARGAAAPTHPSGAYAKTEPQTLAKLYG
ncbi:hypothetical protein [Polaromonas jejuensis]|uniref:Uncharacterized protein n=1 Tax=Polaromonas jejuensis TaxID=457502 RepID=A0ABW0Q561_9BURK|nr:hypothetical protein [Polaromonas jejuensis]